MTHTINTLCSWQEAVTTHYNRRSRLLLVAAAVDPLLVLSSLVVGGRACLAATGRVESLSLLVFLGAADVTAVSEPSVAKLLPLAFASRPLRLTGLCATADCCCGGGADWRGKVD